MCYERRLIMNRIHNQYHYHQPDRHSDIRSLVLNLGSRDFLIRGRARVHLMELGNEAVDDLAVALDCISDELLRWEVVKILAHLHSPGTLPILINTLEDRNFSIRWMAARGLIEAGEIAVKPVLKRLIEKPDSAFLREGVHHVCKELTQTEQHTHCRQLLRAIEAPDSPENVAVVAAQLLNNLKSTEVNQPSYS